MEECLEIKLGKGKKAGIHPQMSQILADEEKDEDFEWESFLLTSANVWASLL